MWNREYNWFLIHDIRQSSYKDRCTYDDNPWKRSKASSRGVLSGNLQAGSIVRFVEIGLNSKRCSFFPSLRWRWRTVGPRGAVSWRLKSWTPVQRRPRFTIDSIYLTATRGDVPRGNHSQPRVRLAKGERANSIATRRHSIREVSVCVWSEAFVPATLSLKLCKDAWPTIRFLI